MFYGRGVKHRMDRIHERVLQLIYTGQIELTFTDLLTKVMIV